MPVDISTVERGKCFKTKFGEIRRVVLIDEFGRVIYSSQMKTDGGGISIRSNLPPISKVRFAQEAETEIVCPTGL
jgi:hypothetical protein